MPRELRSVDDNKKWYKLDIDNQILNAEYKLSKDMDLLVNSRRINYITAAIYGIKPLWLIGKPKYVNVVEYWLRFTECRTKKYVLDYKDMWKYIIKYSYFDSRIFRLIKEYFWYIEIMFKIWDNKDIKYRCRVCDNFIDMRCFESDCYKCSLKINGQPLRKIDINTDRNELSASRKLYCDSIRNIYESELFYYVELYRSNNKIYHNIDDNNWDVCNDIINVNQDNINCNYEKYELIKRRLDSNNFMSDDVMDRVLDNTYIIYTDSSLMDDGKLSYAVLPI